MCPTRSHGYDSIVDDPRNTITYDEHRAGLIDRREAEVGSDGRLLVDTEGLLVRVDLVEKLLVPALAKLTNLVPDGGIWLNTQRPEWNDANNALAGPGLSMVTLYHLHAYLRFLGDQVHAVPETTVALTASVAEWLSDVLAVVEALPSEAQPIDDRLRRSIVDSLGGAGWAHRRRVGAGVDSATVAVAVDDLRRLCSQSCRYLRDSIRSARRTDGLFHSYNRLSFPTDDEAHVDHLGLMLEGQVAVLSSGALDPEESLEVLHALFASDMYRTDQNTFMLYPATVLPSFLDRNLVPEEAAAMVPALSGSLEEGLQRILDRGPDGLLHFRPGIANETVLDELLDRSDWPPPTGAACNSSTRWSSTIDPSPVDRGACTATRASVRCTGTWWPSSCSRRRRCTGRLIDRGDSVEVIDGLRASVRTHSLGSRFQEGSCDLRCDPDGLLLPHACTRGCSAARNDRAGEGGTADPAWGTGSQGGRRSDHTDAWAPRPP